MAQMTNQNQSKETTNLITYIDAPKIKQRFVDILGKKRAEQFKTALIHIYNSNSLFQKCSPASICGAAINSAILDLDINPNKGLAYIVPYKDKATFQIGWKGLYALAMRSNKIVRFDVHKVYEGEIRDRNIITGELITGERVSNKIAGYVAYIKLNNGFEDYRFMTVAEMENHAEKYSKSYAYDLRSRTKSSIWSTNFDAMAFKTVAKRLLSALSFVFSDDLNAVLQTDQAVIEDDTVTYVDNDGNSKPLKEIFPTDNSSSELEVIPIDAVTSDDDSTAQEAQS